jgi:hypothetical protein
MAAIASKVCFFYSPRYTPTWTEIKNRPPPDDGQGEKTEVWWCVFAFLLFLKIALDGALVYVELRLLSLKLKM